MFLKFMIKVTTSVKVDESKAKYISSTISVVTVRPHNILKHYGKV